MPSRPSVAELRPEVAREIVVAVDLGGARRDLVGGEAAHGVAQHVDGLAEVEVEARKPVRKRGHALVRSFGNDLSCGQSIADPARPAKSKSDASREETSMSDPALSYVHGASAQPLLGETIGANFDRTVAR